MVKMNKKAISHVEVIISLVIFVGFLVFLFLLFPSSLKVKSKIGLDVAERGITNFSAAEVNYVSIYLNENSPESIRKAGGCFRIVLDKELGFLKDYNAIVEDETFNQINSSIDVIENEKFLDIEGKGSFYMIYFSREFDEKHVNSQECYFLNKSEEGYVIGLTRTYNAISNKKLKLLNDTYYSDYNKLLSQFNMPKSSDFGFILKELNGTEMMRVVKKKPKRAETLAREIPVQIIYGDGTFKYALLNIQIW